MVPLNETNPIVAGDKVTLTCRSKNKDDMDLAWRWLPLNQTNQISTMIDINANHLPAGDYKDPLKRNSPLTEFGTLLGGEGYLLPFENETSPQEYPAPLGTYQVHRLKWEHIPKAAAGVYQCYDALNLMIPTSNITLNILSNRIFMRFQF